MQQESLLTTWPLPVSFKDVITFASLLDLFKEKKENRSPKEYENKNLV